jgi:2'-5' RNA ligase
MSVIRAFIAIDLSPEIQRKLVEVQENYKSQLNTIPVRWVPVTNIHLTLKFLGDVSLSNINILTEMLLAEVSNHHQFEITVGGSGTFPNLRQPRVIWIGIQAPQELTIIQRGIEATTTRMGYTREDRGFSPHLTLGRVSRNATSQDVKAISHVIEKTRIGFLGATNVEEVHLYRSDLNPNGAVYTRIFTASLVEQKIISER